MNHPTNQAIGVNDPSGGNGKTNCTLKLRRYALGTLRPLTYLATAAMYLFACCWVGFMFGWLVGASLSPIASTVAPLVFGLLAVIGVGLGAKKSGPKLSNLWHTFFVAFGVVIFCITARTGLQYGVRDRVDPFITFETALGTEAWNGVDGNVAHELYRLRWIIREKRLHREEFRLYVADVISPIVESPDISNDEKRLIIEQLVSSIEKLPSIESK